MARAYVLLSGGVDSSTCLAMAKEKYGSVKGLSIIYGQRHNKEIRNALAVAKHLGCEWEAKNITQIMAVGGLTDATLEIPKVSYDELPHGVSPTYVPFRNGILLSVITGMASVDPEAKAVYYGAHAEDAENSAYPDCSEPFIDAIGDAIYIGTYKKIILEAPLSSWAKAEVITEGERLGVPWHLTWSCYEGGHNHCGVCPTCRARRTAFEIAGVDDPTRYDNTKVAL